MGYKMKNAKIEKAFSETPKICECLQHIIVQGPQNFNVHSLF